MTTAFRSILLVEGNPDDVDLTLRAFQRAGITAPVEVVSDGVEALEYLLARGAYARQMGPYWLALNRVPPVGSHP